MSRTEMRGERKRTKKRQNRIPVIAQTWWRKLLHKFFSWALNHLLERILFEVCPFLVALPYFTDSCSKTSWHVLMKYLKM